nr:AMP-binding protein [Spirochaetales bacterium]
MAETLATMFMERVKARPELVMQYSKDGDGRFQPTSYAELLEHVATFAAGLLELGLRRGDRIGLISDNRREWLISDLAIIGLGAADVPRGCDATDQELAYILSWSECAVAIVENDKQLAKLVARKREMPLLSTVVSFDPPSDGAAAAAKGAGFTNVDIDSDGVRRRIKLVDFHDGKPYLQLSLAPLLDRLGKPGLVYGRRELRLIGAKYPDGVRDVRIPLAMDGTMLIRWPKKTYIDSFDHIAFHDLLTYRDEAGAFADAVRLLRANQGWTLGPGYAPVDACLAAWDESEAYRETALDSGSAEDREAWLASRREYWLTVGEFVGMDYGDSVPALYDAARDADDPAYAELYDQMRDDFSLLWNRASESYARHLRYDEHLRGKLEGAFCIVGWTSTGSTDFGVNPFDSEYENVGTHAAVANTILQRDFLREAPLWISSLLSLALAAAVLLVIGRLGTRAQLLVGLGMTVAVALADYAVFHFTGVYVAVLSPLLATLVSFIAYSLLSFLLSEREKSFLRKAFSTYLSGDVINEIISDPSMLKLGGQKKWITAMFTDIRGFSTISEALDAEQLVKLLNIYLSGMSDIILENRGTIDKYEGDALMAEFGAPLPD